MDRIYWIVADTKSFTTQQAQIFKHVEGCFEISFNELCINQMCMAHINSLLFLFYSVP